MPQEILSGTCWVEKVVGKDVPQHVDGEKWSAKIGMGFWENIIWETSTRTRCNLAKRFVGQFQKTNPQDPMDDPFIHGHSNWAVGVEGTGDPPSAGPPQYELIDSLICLESHCARQRRQVEEGRRCSAALAPWGAAWAGPSDVSKWHRCRIWPAISVCSGGSGYARLQGQGDFMGAGRWCRRRNHRTAVGDLYE